MKFRLDLLESFMQPSTGSSREVLAKTKNDFFVGSPGSLTIVDLTDLRH
jgi:hypothetical protein